MRYWQESFAIANRIFCELWRRQRSLIFWGLFPIFILLLNGLILAERAQLTLGAAMGQAAPGTLVGAALFFSCLGGSVATVVAEREQQTLKRLFLSPLAGLSYFGGIFLVHGAIAAAQTAIVCLLALALGATFSTTFVWGLGVIILSVCAYTGLGFILGGLLARRTEDVNALVAAFGVPLLILGGAFMPVTFFPDSLKRLAEFNPIYHMNEALSGLWLTDSDLTAALQHSSILLLFAVASALGGWWTYQWMILREKQL
ncbi:MAG: ABC transporter permease [Cyanobacteria bacterium P01_H01_bin.15]